LFIEFRCAKCHPGRAADPAVPELAMDAPSFEGIGSRRDYDWMARWVADPKVCAHRANAEIVSRRASCEGCGGRRRLSQFIEIGFRYEGSDGAGRRLAEAGKRAFETLHCIACHNTPGTSEKDPQKISFSHVREKFAPGALNSFLRKPEEHYVWIRMPNFKLTADEAAQLAAFLELSADKPKSVRLQPTG